MVNYHLVILKKPYLEAIFDGRKTIESRFTKTKRGGVGRVGVGDKVFLKESSGSVCGKATVAKVENFENMCPLLIRKIKQKFNKQILGGDEYWDGKVDSRYGFLVWLEDVERIEPVRIEKKDWRAWVVLSEEQNWGLLK